tara:strand:- start:862 stop:1626 length:765 start_codon:yes stop_codon:yes gene_type:complete
MNYNNIAIIGDSGFIGKEIIKTINTDYRYNSNNINLFDKNISTKLNGQIDTIIFLAGDPKIYYYKNNPLECFKNNYEIVKNILKNKNLFFIYLSSICVYSDLENFSTNPNLGWNSTTTFYGLSKLLAEYEIKSSSNNYCILRLGTPFGDGMRKGPLFDILNNHESYVNLNSRYSFIHLEDISNGIKFVIKKRLRGIYNLTANESISLIELIDNPNKIKIKNNKTIIYDSENSTLTNLGWKQNIFVKDWVESLKL